MTPKAPKTKVERLNNIQLQSSTFGLPLAIYYGTNRGAGNLIWYGNFKAIPHTQKQAGGKGLFAPSSKTTDYTYTAAVMMALGEGPITGIGTVWKGKDVSSLSALGLTLIPGNSGQAVWSFLSSYNQSGNWSQDVAYGYPTNPAFTDQKLGYDTTALLVASAYDLGSDATIPNHGFEIKGTLIHAAGSGKDCNPKDFVADFLTNAQYGAGIPSSWLGDHTAFSNYCLANGILLSPVIADAQPAASHLKEILAACNTDPLWSEGVLKLLPRGDTAVTGNGATYTPDLTPIYDLADDDFGKDLDGPVILNRATPADAYNEIRIEIANRANQYNVEVIAQNDQNAVERYGLRQAPVQSMHFICESSVGKFVAQMLVQRSVYNRNTYDFPLTERFALLEPGDYVTLTDANLQMSRVLVRITEMEESEDGYDCKGEEVAVGVAAPALYPHDSGLRFIQDFNSSPQSVAAPYIFELPADPSATGLSLGIAVGQSAGDLRYGGCTVWCSADGVNYQQVGVINGSSRYGTLTASLAAGGATMSVALASGGQLPTVSATEAAQGATMISIDHEYLDYTTATLTGTNAYNLTGLNRGFFETTPASHSNGAKWARIDEAICRLDDLDLMLIGESVWFKFTAFNTYRGGEQALSDVTAYSYAISGYMESIGRKAKLEQIGADEWLTPVEKQTVIKDWAAIANEKATLDAQADALGFSRVAYDSTYVTLSAYLTSLTPAWNDTSQSTGITRATWNTNWGNFETARRALVVALDAAALGTIEFFDPMDYATAADFLAAWPSSGATGDISIVTSSDTGGKAVQIGNNSGNDYVQIFHGKWLPYSPEDLYEVYFDLDTQAAQAGALLYLGVQAVDRAGNNLGGSFNYVAAAGVAEPSTLGRQTWRGFMRGTAAVTGSHAPAPRDAPVPMPDGSVSGFGQGGTVKIRMMGLIHYSAHAGRSVLHGAGLRKAEDVTVIWTGDWVNTRQYFPNDGVLYLGRSFAAKVKHTNQTPPSTATSNAYWYLVADKGADGSPGAAGLSIAELTIFKRATSAPSTPSGGSYDFGTKILTPPSGWSTQFPSGTDPCYSSRGVAFIQGVTGTDVPDWLGVGLAVQNGEDGDAGAPGSGTNIVFKRGTSTPSTPSPSAGTPSGWYDDVNSVPAGAGQIYASFGTRPNPSSNWTWQTPARVEGVDGTDGVSPVMIVAQPETVNVLLNADGSEKSGQMPKAYAISALQGGSSVSITSITITDETNCDGSVSGNTVYLDDVTGAAEEGSISFDVVAAGQTVPKTVTFSTSRDGSTGASAATLGLGNTMTWSTYTQHGGTIAINASSTGKLRLNLTGALKTALGGFMNFNSKIEYSVAGSGTWTMVTGSEHTSTDSEELSEPTIQTAANVNGSGPYDVTGLTASGAYLIRAMTKKNNAAYDNPVSGGITLYAEQIT